MELSWGLYLISDETMVEDGSFPRLLARALEGGLRVAQLRAKRLDRETLRRAGEAARALTSAHGAALIVNDDAHLARELDADGVHLGQGDMAPEEARRILGPERLVGLSTHSREQIHDAGRKPVDYIGVGPVFATRTKTDAEPAVGLELVEFAMRNARVPVVAIGGIRLANLDSVLRTGVRNVAVVSAISRNADSVGAAREFLRRTAHLRPARPPQEKGATHAAS